MIDLLTNSALFTIMSVIETECTHAVSPSASFQGRACVLCCGTAAVVVRQSLDGLHGLHLECLGTRHDLLSSCVLPPILFLLPPDLHSYITSQLKQHKAVSRQLPRTRNSNSCRSATYANMFTHGGILSKENLPQSNS